MFTTPSDPGSFPVSRAYVSIASVAFASVAVSTSCAVATAASSRTQHPPGFELDPGIRDAARRAAENNGGSVTITHDREGAFAGADVVYGKSWVSSQYYGDWDSEQAYRKTFEDQWRITAEAMAGTHRARFMHPLPVRRNVVADDAVMDGPDCVVYQQAENRLHAQNALLVSILQ